MIDKQLVERNFSRQAEAYDEFANVQKRMAERLVDRLPEADVHRILEVGCGTGYLTKLLLDRYPGAELVAVDLAEGMVDHARKRFSGKAGVEFIHADIEEEIPAGPFCLIVSNAAFQWLNEPEKTIGRLAASLCAGGALHFTTLGDRTFHELEESRRIAEQTIGIRAVRDGMFRAALCWASYCAREEAAVHIEQEEIIEHFPTARTFLKAVKKIGANASSEEVRMGLPLMRRTLDIYDATYGDEAGVRATYEVVHAILSKAERVDLNLE